MQSQKTLNQDGLDIESILNRAKAMKLTPKDFYCCSDQSLIHARDVFRSNGQYQNMDLIRLAVLFAIHGENNRKKLKHAANAEPVYKMHLKAEMMLNYLLIAYCAAVFIAMGFISVNYFTVALVFFCVHFFEYAFKHYELGA